MNSGSAVVTPPDPALVADTPVMGFGVVRERIACPRTSGPARGRRSAVCPVLRSGQWITPFLHGRERIAAEESSLAARTEDALGTAGHETHPATGTPLVGETLPMWDRVLDLARTTAPIFAPVRYQSMDTAITEAGPLLVEIDTGGSFTLPRFATGRDFLTDPVRGFFRDCGYPKV